jgi:hypothetical protein
MTTPVPHSPAVVLRITLAQATPPLRAAAAEIWRRPGIERRYPVYLRRMHEVVRASVPLMELAAQRCRLLGPVDPVAVALRHYLEAHIEQERGHDDWLLDDLAAADPGPAGAGVPPPVVARLVGTQYYWIAQHHPVALLGYIAVLEGNAPDVRLANRIMATAGVSEAAVRTVRAHAELDTDHTGAVYALLDTLPLTPTQLAAVTVSGLHTTRALMALFEHIARVPTDIEHGGT